MSVLENTYAASYKGVQFFVDRISSTSGRTKANYLFLNSGRRTSKDLGALPSTFRVTGFTYSQDGDTYAAKRDALRSVLDSELDGIFVHPFAGEFYCSHDSYTWEEDFSKLNICRFTFTLSQVSKDGANPLTPTGEIFNSSQIREQALTVNRAIQAACADVFSTSTVVNKDCADKLFEDSGDSFKNTFASIGETIADVNSYVGKAIEINEKAAYYSANPLAGFAALADGILGVDGLTADTYKKFRTVQAMFNYGNNDSDYSVVENSPTRIDETPTTPEDAERLRNAEAVKTFMQTTALAEAYNYTGSTDYTSTDEIDDTLDILNEQFVEVSELLTDDNLSVYTVFDVDVPEYTDTYNELLKLRRYVEGYLRTLRASAAYVKIIRVEPMPASVLAYKLYGDSSRSDEIMKLNGLSDPFSVSGQIKVLSE